MEETISDQVSTEIAVRQAIRAIRTGKITAQEIQEAVIYIKCNCGHLQKNSDQCANCGEVWE